MERREREDWRPWESDQRADRSTRSIRIRIIGSLTSKHSSPCRGFFRIHVRPFSLSISISVSIIAPSHFLPIQDPARQIEISVLTSVQGSTNILNEIKQFFNQVFRIPFPIVCRKRSDFRSPLSSCECTLVPNAKRRNTRTKQSESWIDEDICENFCQPWITLFVSFSFSFSTILNSSTQVSSRELFPKSECVFGES